MQIFFMKILYRKYYIAFLFKTQYNFSINLKGGRINMKITYIGQAGLLIEKNGVKI